MDINDLPLLALCHIVRQTRAIDRHSLKLVSRAWKEAVESQVTTVELRNQGGYGNTPLPRNLAKRFPGLERLDLGIHQGFTNWADDELHGALLNLPHLKDLAGYDGIKHLRQRNSPEQLKQRADLAARLTRLSVTPDSASSGVFARDMVSIADIAQEFGNIVSFTLPLPFGARKWELDEMKPFLTSLKHLQVDSWQLEEIVALLGCKEARDLKTLKLTLHSRGEIPVQFNPTPSELSIYKNVAEIAGLEVLELTGLGLSDIGIGSLNSLAQLTHLSLAQLHVTSHGLSQLTRLSNVRILKLQKSMLNNLRAWPIGLPEALKPFKQLLHLDVGLCSDLKADNTLGQFTSLTSLRANGCHKFGTLEPLRHLARLQDLQVAETRGYRTIELTALQGLTSLDLSRSAAQFLQQSVANNLKDCDMEALGQLASLCRLNLQGHSAITAAGLRHLAGLDSLAFLNIQGCSWEVVEFMAACLKKRSLETHSSRFRGLAYVWPAPKGASPPPISWPSPEQAFKLLQSCRGI